MRRSSSWASSPRVPERQAVSPIAGSAAAGADTQARSLLRGAGGFLAVQVAGTGLAFAAQVLLARLLGAAAYGDYVVAYAWVALLAAPATAGHSTAALRFVAQYAGAGDWARLRGYLNVALGSTALVTGAAALALAAAAARLPVDSAFSAALWAGAFVLPLQSGLVLLSSILRGLRFPVWSQVPASLVQHGVMIGCAALSVLLLWPPSSAAAMRWAGIASAAALAGALALLVRGLPREARRVRRMREGGTWTRVALPLLWITGVNLVMQRADVLIVGAVVDSEAAGVYSAASRLSLLIGFGLTAVNAWMAPAIADLHARGDRAGLQRVVTLAARAITAFTLPVAVGLVAAGEWLLGLFGAGFAAGRVALGVLCIGQVANALLGPVGYLMTMTGNQAAAARILTVAALANVALCALLAPSFGIEGAALGTAFAQVLWNVWMSVEVRRRLAVRATVL